MKFATIFIAKHNVGSMSALVIIENFGKIIGKHLHKRINDSLLPISFKYK